MTERRLAGPERHLKAVNFGEIGRKIQFEAAGLDRYLRELLIRNQDPERISYYESDELIARCWRYFCWVEKLINAMDLQDGQGNSLNARNIIDVILLNLERKYPVEVFESRSVVVNGEMMWFGAEASANEIKEYCKLNWRGLRIPPHMAEIDLARARLAGAREGNGAVAEWGRIGDGADEDEWDGIEDRNGARNGSESGAMAEADSFEADLSQLSNFQPTFDGVVARMATFERDRDLPGDNGLKHALGEIAELRQELQAFDLLSAEPVFVPKVRAGFGDADSHDRALMEAKLHLALEALDVIFACASSLHQAGHRDGQDYPHMDMTTEERRALLLWQGVSASAGVMVRTHALAGIGDTFPWEEAV